MADRNKTMRAKVFECLIKLKCRIRIKVIWSRILYYARIWILFGLKILLNRYRYLRTGTGTCLTFGTYAVKKRNRFVYYRC